MTINQERNYILQHPLYKNSMTWRASVMRMPDYQVHAIYKKFQKKDYKKLEMEIKKQNKENEKYHQMDIFEYMEDKGHA